MEQSSENLEEDILNVMIKLEADAADGAAVAAADVEMVPAASSTEIKTEVKQEVVEIVEPQKCHLDCLRKSFGHSAFRECQWKVIEAVLVQKRDAFAIMATGYGKSLCFQFPAVFSKGITLVVSPLISLMEDQVLALSVSNIPACLLGTAQSDKNIELKVLNCDYRVVYASPEYLTNRMAFLQQLSPKLTLIAIDEAHCISQWGHDFRNDYRKLGIIRETVKNVPILAVTATATRLVGNDICKSLGLNNPLIVSTGFERPNLELIVRQKGNAPWQDLGPMISAHKNNGSIIIYCISRNETEQIAGILKRESIRCEFYHAKLSTKVRREIHHNFIRDKVPVIVATTAFGMGIDKPDVRCVIHYGAAQTLERYYQEIGRAGRDGLPAKCITLFERADFDVFDGKNQYASEEIKEYMGSLKDQMMDYCFTKECRRVKIQKYFEGDEYKGCIKPVKCCDNCQQGVCHKTHDDLYEGLDNQGLYDYTTDAFNLLSTIKIFNGYSGIMKPIHVLRGCRTTNIKKYWDKPFHGTGKYKSELYWRAFADLLIKEKFIDKITPTAPTVLKSIVMLTRKATLWLADKKRQLKLQPPSQMCTFLKMKKDAKPLPEPQAPAKETVETISLNKLKLELRKLRNSIADRENIIAYTLVTDLALEQMARLQPKDLSEMRSHGIDGLSDYKILKYGNEFLNAILKYKIKEENERQPMHEILQTFPLRTFKCARHHHEAMKLIRNSELSLDQITDILHVGPSVVVAYMEVLIKCGYEITKDVIKRLLKLSDQSFNEISKEIKKSNINEMKVTTLKNKFPNRYSWDQLLTVLAYYEIREYMNNLKIPYKDPDIESVEVLCIDQNKIDLAILEQEIILSQKRKIEQSAALDLDYFKDDNDDTMNKEEDKVDLALLEQKIIKCQKRQVEQSVALDLDYFKDDEDDAMMIEYTEKRKKDIKIEENSCDSPAIDTNSNIDSISIEDDENDLLLKHISVESTTALVSSESSNTSSNSRLTTAAKRKKYIQYDSDSDDGEKNRIPPQPPQHQCLPRWLIEANKNMPSTTTSSSQSTSSKSIKKRNVF